MPVRLLLFLIAFGVHELCGQNDLSGSLRRSPYTKIYKLTSDEARELVGKDGVWWSKKLFHSPVDSFVAGNKPPRLNDGNYVYVHAREGSIQYKLHSVGDVNIKLLNQRNQSAIVVHTKSGTVISDAKVFIRKRQLVFDEALNAFPFKSKYSEEVVSVLYRDVLYPFEVSIQRPLRRSWIRRIRNWFASAVKPRNREYHFPYSTPYESKFHSFIAFSKPLYRPRDTVKLKAFIQAASGKRLDKALLVRITDGSLDTDTIVARIKPYREGGYSYSFVLADSLNLRLDDEYTITLEETRSSRYDVNEYDGDLDEDVYAAKRKVVARGKFEYEDYELKNIQFSARAARSEHHRGDENSVFLKATDENDLPVLDGRAELYVITNPSTDVELASDHIFIRDTLWHFDTRLDPVGETKISLPDSIFPDASFEYKIQCEFLNSDNQRRDATIHQHFFRNREYIDIARNGDSLNVKYISNGQVRNGRSMMIAEGHDGDTIEQMSISVPAQIKIHPFASDYSVQIDSSYNSLDVSDGSSNVYCSTRRTRDSVFISLSNPGKVGIWYALFAGDKLVTNGYDSIFIFAGKSVTANNYYLTLRYVSGGTLKESNYTIPHHDQFLQIRVDQPRVIYPGLKTAINIHVTGPSGAPVGDADVTAYALTKKFDYRLPAIPYFGKLYPDRQRFSRWKDDEAKFSGSGLLNWEQWSKELHLDKTEYYRFLHPHPIYRNYEPAPDSITQIAPFAILNGKIEPIAFLQIDHRPVFFSQSQQFLSYSFPISKGKHSLQMRTRDRLITVDSVLIEAGRKNFISVDADSSMEGVIVQHYPDTLTDHEQRLWNKYAVLIKDNFQNRFATIQNEDRLILLHPRSTNYFSMIAPVTPVTSQLRVRKSFDQDFVPEGGSEFEITKGLIRQTIRPGAQRLGKSLNQPEQSYNFKDYVLTEDAIDSLWEEYAYQSSRDAHYPDYFNSRGPGRGRLIIQLGKALASQRLLVKNMVLSRHNHANFSRIYAGSESAIGYLDTGRYRMLYLLKDNRYFVADSLLVTDKGINAYALNEFSIQPADSFSIRLAAYIEDRYVFRYSNDQQNNADNSKRLLNARFLSKDSFTKQISGRVTDKKGLPIIGAVVAIRQTSYSTVTDREGYFSLAVPDHGTITLSSVGYEMKEFDIGLISEMNIQLAELTNALTEVVVVGYAQNQRRSMAGAMSVVSDLQGTTPGVLIDVEGVQIPKVSNVQLTDSKIDEPPGNPNTIRRNFRDDAFWQPMLRTDENGKASFDVVFPDDITNWSTCYVAFGGKKMSGYTTGSIKSYKILSSNIGVPQFAIAGDSIGIIGKSLNYRADTVRGERSFYINDTLRFVNNLSFTNSVIDTFSITIPNGDSTRFKYSFTRDNGYFDGEERSIPVFRPGVIETDGMFAALRNDTSFDLPSRFMGSTVQLYAETSPVPVLHDEAEKVINYEYLCNEQLASKLKALLVQKKISEYLGKKFLRDEDVKIIINKLLKGRSRNTLWGWWPNNEFSMWISLHVLESLSLARNSGYAVPLADKAISDYLVYELTTASGTEMLAILDILYNLKAKVDFKRYLDSFEVRKNSLSMYERLRAVELRQKTGEPVELDSFIARMQTTAFGNMYWGEENEKFFDNSIQNTLLMYRLLRAQTGHEYQLRSIISYLLEKRNAAGWRNTYESSRILETILPELIRDSLNKEPAPLQIKIKDSIVESSYPVSRQIHVDGAVTISKAGKSPVYFTAYRRQWNPAPVKKDGIFSVSSWFQGSGHTLAFLKAGQPATLHVEVKVMAHAEYVMIEIPIPAGCSYESKNQAWRNSEVHREYFRNKVSIFCNQLPKGNYRFEVSLLPRYNGRFTLNPAKAEMMYFPVFYGRDGIRKVDIR
jgi:hypothetical protein